MREWTWPFTDNFTGPNWSDGKWQGSVLMSSNAPVSKLDRRSRIHDARFFAANNLDDLDKADMEYYESTRDMSLIPSIIGAMPLIGNAPLRALYRFMGMNEVNFRSDDQPIPVGISAEDYIGLLEQDERPSAANLYGRLKPRIATEEDVIKDRIAAIDNPDSEDDYQIVYAPVVDKPFHEPKYLEPDGTLYTSVELDPDGSVTVYDDHDKRAPVSDYRPRDPPPLNPPGTVAEEPLHPVNTRVPNKPTLYPTPLLRKVYNPVIPSNMGVRSLRRKLRSKKVLVGGW